MRWAAAASEPPTTDSPPRRASRIGRPGVCLSESTVRDSTFAAADDDEYPEPDFVPAPRMRDNAVAQRLEQLRSQILKRSAGGGHRS